MIKKYLPTSSKIKRKSNRTLKRKLLSSFLEKKATRKYQKRKKNIFQKFWKKISIFSNLSSKVILFLLLLCIITASAFFLLYSSYTSISKINIYREGALIDINRAYWLLDYLRGKSLINIDNASIAQRLQKSQSSISEIRINKDFPDTINIYLNSYKLVFQTQHHFILENGSVILKENEQYPDTQFIYLSEDISEYVDFQKKLRTQELNTIHTIIDESKKNILWFNPVQFFYFIKERELLIKDSLWTIYIFDLQQDIDAQIRRLAIYDKESNENKRDLQVYIDLRISEKIFLCTRETEDTCKNNIEKIYWSSIFFNPLPEVSESQQ